MRIRPFILSAILAATAASPGWADGAPAIATIKPLHIIARYPIGGNDTGYDYLQVDVPKRHLFVAHATRVEVLNADNGAKLGEIGGMRGAHGIEIIPSLGKGYTSDGLDRAVTVFDRDTFRILGRIRYMGVKPDAIRFDPETSHLFVVNGGETGDVTVIDPVTDAIIGTVQLGGQKLEQIGFDGRGRAFVNDEGTSVIHVFDTHTLKPLSTWPLAPCEEPTGLAVDLAHHRAFAACGNERLAVVDTNNGNLVTTVPIGRDPDGAFFDPATQRLITSNREGTLSVLREVTPDRYETLQTLKTEPGARTLTFDEQTGRIFLPVARAAPAAAGGGRPAILPETFAVLAVGP